MPPADSHPELVPWHRAGEAPSPLAEQVAVGGVLHRPPTPNRFAGAGGVESELHLNKPNPFAFGMMAGGTERMPYGIFDLSFCNIWKLVCEKSEKYLETVGKAVIEIYPGYV